MAAELGHFSAILALALAVTQATSAVFARHRATDVWTHVARRAARTQALLLGLSFACLAWSFAVNDFTVLNVAQHSHSRLPVPYRLAATWGSHEGSLLLWTLMLGGWTAAITLFSRSLPDDMVTRALGVLGSISAGFLLFLLLTSNPFLRLATAPPDGLDLNPLLQDVAMILHPPLLYMGYVGFSVVFAFAVAALLAGRLDAAWARWSRPWATMAWTFLTCGIALGSFWAYYELGWGGWWFWDPVENASFVPWLVGTALMHSLAVTDRRGAFRSWTVLLAIATFSLSLLGAFLVRSGVLTSVHAFVTDPARGVFLLALFAAVVGGSLLLYAARAGALEPGGAFAPVSRESFLLANNVLFSVAAASVLLGTLYPLVVDAIGGTKLSVGPPYFNTVFVAIMVPLLFLLGVGPSVRWQQASLPDLVKRLRWPLAVSILVSLSVSPVLGRWQALVSVGLLLALWIGTTAALGLWETLMVRGWRRLFGAMTSRSLGYYGMHVAHLGVAVSVAGITIVSAYQAERDARMDLGDRVSLAGYGFTFNGVTDVAGANYLAARAAIEVSRGDRTLLTLYPEKRVYGATRTAMTEAAIDMGVLRHLYVSLGDPLDGTAWRVQIHYKPFVGWIWAGALLMAAGGLMTVFDRRYTRPPGGGHR